MSFPFALPMLLDGSTGVSLYQRGMPQGVCVEQWAVQNPRVIQDLQREFFAAGSDAVYAPTFSANRAKLSHYGLEEQTASLNQTLAALSLEAAEGKLVGGDLSPTGLFIQPFGEASFDQILEVYREQAQALKKAGVHFLVCETMMTLPELRAAVLACKETGLPTFATVTVDQKGNTLGGSSLLCCYAAARALGADAFGLNCSFGAERMLPILQELVRVSDLPVIAKPNAGMPSPQDPLRYSLSPEEMAQGVKGLLEAGVQIVGGCCGASPEYIAALRRLLDGFDFSCVQAEQDPDRSRLVADGQSAFFLPEYPEFTDPIPCAADMTDSLLDAEDSGCDAALIQIDSLEDAQAFGENAYMLKMPAAFCSSNLQALERALLLYQGRGVLDSRGGLPREQLEGLASRYGALIY